MLKISKISWLVLLGYLALGVFTYLSISLSTVAKDLFSQTEFLMQFNLVWFGLLILFYGVYALAQNYRRIKRLGLEESLDTQFLIVLTFFFLTIYAIIDFWIYINQNTLSDSLSVALESTGKVFFYGAFMAGLLRILLPKLLSWWKKRKTGA